MPRATFLFHGKQTKIVVHDHLNLSQNAIAKQLNRFKAAVRNVLNEHVGYKTKRRDGALSKLSSIAKSNIVRQASKKDTSANELRTCLRLELSIRRFQQLLRDSPQLHNKNMKCAYH